MLGVMTQDNIGGVPSPSSITDWVSRFGLTHPLVADTTGDQETYIVTGFPTYIVIDRDMTIVSEDLWPFTTSGITPYL